MQEKIWIFLPTKIYPLVVLFRSNNELRYCQFVVFAIQWFIKEINATPTDRQANII